MKKLISDLTLIIPTKNDHIRIENNLEYIINFLFMNTENFEIIIVSNGSSKYSETYIDKIIKRFENITHLKTENSGKGLAIRNGIIESKFQNILYTDADLSVDISEFKHFVDKGNLISGFVIGNRKNILSKNIGSPISRKITGVIYLYFIRKIFKFSYEDTQCGFKAINTISFTTSKKFITNGFSFDLELILLAEEEGVEITEVPVKYIHNDESKVKILSDSINMIKEIYKIKKEIVGIKN